MRRKIGRLCLCCVCLFLFTGCGVLEEVNSEFVIKVRGTEGLKFSGHYSFVGTNGLPEPVNASGVASGEYKGRGAMALCYFRKLTEQGSLRVEIVKDGKVVSEAETSIPFGFVSLKTPMPEKNTIISQLLRKILGSE